MGKRTEPTRTNCVYYRKVNDDEYKLLFNNVAEYMVTRHGDVFAHRDKDGLIQNSKNVDYTVRIRLEKKDMSLYNNYELEGICYFYGDFPQRMLFKGYFIGIDGKANGFTNSVDIWFNFFQMDMGADEFTKEYRLLLQNEIVK